MALQEEKDALLDFIEENGLGEESIEKEDRDDREANKQLQA